MTSLFESVKQNALYVLSFALIIIALFLVAYLFEVLAKKKNGDTERILTTRKIAVCGMFSAIAAILMLFEIPMFFAPVFYKLDLSELPILIGSFAFGPVAGVFMEFVKILLKLIIKGTSTAFVGELANFAVGCSFILPATIIYQFKKTKKNAIIASIIGTIVITIFGTTFNAVYLLPAFAALYGMPLEALLGMGAEANSLVDGTSIVSFVVCCVAPLNLIKGIILVHYRIKFKPIIFCSVENITF